MRTYKDPVLLNHTAGLQTTVVKGGLHYIKGNKAPYFSITCDIYQGGRDDGGGAAHDHILKIAPQFAQLVAMHLSDIDGAPMHGEGNGWYHLVGAIPVLHGDNAYHAGNSKRHINSEYRYPNTEECLQFFADYVRCSLLDAAKVRDMVVASYNSVNQYDRVYTGEGNKVARAAFAEWIEQQRPRWKQEAVDCIKTYGLAIYGDNYTPKD